jgi:hypothetical protein
MLSLWGCDKLSVVADYGSITSERALDIATMLAKDVAGGLDPQKRKIALREEDKRDPTTRRCAGSRWAWGGCTRNRDTWCHDGMGHSTRASGR